MEGWLKIHRKITDWEWYRDANTMRVFLHLLLTASNRSYVWRGVQINPGNVIVGRKQLSNELGLSEQQIRTSLLHLKSTSEITINSTNKYSIITISKWDDYQENKNVKQPTKQPTITQSSNQQSTTSREYKNIRSKEDKEYIDIYNSIAKYFDPKNVNQKTWVDEIRKLIDIDKHTPDEIISAVKWAREDSFWSSNFMSLKKLRLKDKQGVAYIDLFINKSKANKQQQQNKVQTFF
jgi:hypothetical protein